ncbi:MAG: hypothetical protein LBG27_11090 [Spirochaetaceae bacterium]|nr:hypothetical protein [Spirochaetaceae bacterium]
MKGKRFVRRSRGAAAVFGFCCALFAAALALTGCGSESSGTGSAEKLELTLQAAVFSNSTGESGRAIDAIGEALSKGASSVLIQLEAAEETVRLTSTLTDIGRDGLVLTHIVILLYNTENICYTMMYGIRYEIQKACN